MPRATLIVLLLLAVPLQAQFTPATPGYEFAFPRDHGSHDEYQTEWWYYTGHLRTADGHRFGFEVTFFRVGIAPLSTPVQSQWDLRHLSMAHFAITDVDGKAFRYYEKLNRSSSFTAYQAAGHLDVMNEGWRATTMPDGSWRIVAFAGASAVASSQKDQLDLTLRSRKLPAVHGENGISVKAAGVGYASHYYSMTRLEATGSINGKSCQGQAWMDHEFGSAQLRESQTGWDWFSVQLDNDMELMIYVIRRRDGTPDLTSAGSVITSDGSVIHLRHDQLAIAPLSRWKSPLSGATYPMGWRVSVPSLRIALTLQPLLRQQELVTHASTQVTYWEGAVSVSGSFDSSAVSGEGYVEMTGYDRAFRAP
ncbi:MAG: lipocalin-like domain-containing protein [Acidobacteriota bacterium]